MAILVFTLLMAGDVDSGDTARRELVTRWLWTGESQIAEGVDEKTMWALPGRNHAYYAPYGIGHALVMLPGDMLGTAVASLVPQHLRARVHEGILSYVTFPPLNALAVVLSFLFLRGLTFSCGISLLGTVAFMFSTTFLHYSRDCQENNLMYLLAIGSLVFGMRFVAHGRSRDAAFCAGFLGYAILVRPTTVFLSACTVTALVSCCLIDARERKTFGLLKQRLVTFLMAGVPVLMAFLFIERFYQWYRFGSFLNTYIGVQTALIHQQDPTAPPGYPFGYDFWTGFLGPLISPMKSIFLFDPILLLLCTTVLFYWRRIEIRQWIMLGWMLVALMITICFYASSYWWAGNSAWGPRHETVPVDLLCLMILALAFHHAFSSRRLPHKIAIAGILTISVLIQIESLLLTYNLEMEQLTHDPPTTIVPALRFVNVVTLATGTFESHHLDLGTEIVRKMAHQYMAFLPIRLLGYMPFRIAITVIVAWLIALLCMAFYIACLWRAAWRLSREELRYQREGDHAIPGEARVT